MDPQIPSPNSPAAPAKKLLMIEDEKFITEIYSRALVKAGYKVTAATEGLRGLKLARTNQFDIILLDIMVPYFNGIQVLEHLRREVPELRAKIIIATNLEQKEENRRVLEALSDGYLIKADTTPKELVKFLQQLPA